MNKTAWIFSYKLKKGVSEEQFVELTQKLHDEIISKAKGFISWEHYLQGDIWTDFVLWETEEDANNATTIGKGKEVTNNFYACIQMNTCKALISKLIKKYQIYKLQVVEQSSIFIKKQKMNKNKTIITTQNYIKLFIIKLFVDFFVDENF